MRQNTVLLAGFLILTLSHCGGGGTGPTPPTQPPAPPAPAATPTPTPPPASGGDVVLKVTYSPDRGQQPLTVKFRACDSTGADLRYFADFGDGNGSSQTQGCAFTHKFTADGISAYQVQICAQSGNQITRTCTTHKIVAFVEVKVITNKGSACQARVKATAIVQRGQLDAAAQSEVQGVEFEAREFDSNKVIATRTGIRQSANEWVTGDWAVESRAKLLVYARAYANGNDGGEGHDWTPHCP